jgi:hypothetical protein
MVFILFFDYDVHGIKQCEKQTINDFMLLFIEQHLMNWLRNINDTPKKVNAKRRSGRVWDVAFECETSHEIEKKNIENEEWCDCRGCEQKIKGKRRGKVKIKNYVENNNIEFSEFRISDGDWFILIFLF